MSAKDEAEKKIADFLKSDKKVLLLTGTNTQQKHPLAMAVVRVTLPNAKIFFRTNNQQFMSSVSGFAHADTFNVASQKRTPRDFDVAVVWPIDVLTPDKGGALMSDLNIRGVKKIILTSCLDNHDFTWVNNYDPETVTYDAIMENPAQHEAVKEIEKDVRVSVPSGLPKYAKQTDPKYLVRLHCDRCNAGRWARMNKPFPGMDVLRNAKSGEYTATCLKCGTGADDTYNWYGQS